MTTNEPPAASRYDEAEELASRMSYRPLSPEQSERGVDVVLDLVSESRRLRAGLEELLDVAERWIGGDTSLDPERWYAARDYAKVVLK